MKIELSGRILEYTLERKKVKNINLRVSQKGVFVSAAPRVTQNRIDAFLTEKAELIFKALDKLGAFSPFKAEDGESVSILGKKYILRIEASQRNKYILEDDCLFLMLKNKDDASKLLDKLFKAEAELIVPERCALLCRILERSMPQISYRAMKSRWGSCTPSKNSICINTRLMAAPIECVDYVIAHELCHFLRADHSAGFYKELEKIYPQWKERKKQLAAYSKYLQ